MISTNYSSNIVACFDSSQGLHFDNKPFYNTGLLFLAPKEYWAEKIKLWAYWNERRHRVYVSSFSLLTKHDCGRNEHNSDIKSRVYIRQTPHYAGEIWKRSFISTVWPTVHTNPSQTRSFSKTLFSPEEFENAGFSFSYKRKTFWKRSF